MKKVLIIFNYGFDKSGSPTMVMDLIRLLRPEGYQFDGVYFTNSKAFYLNEFLSYGGKLFMFNKKIEGFRKFIQQHLYYKFAKKVIKKNGPYDIIHCFTERKSEAFLRAAKKLGIKKRVVHVNALYNEQYDFIHKIFQNAIAKSAFKNATKIAGPSIEACETCYGPSDRYIVIPNTYNDEAFKFASHTPDHLVLTQTAHFTSNKNHLFTIEILNEIRKMGINAELNISGDQYDSEYFIKVVFRIQQLDLENYIHFYPFDTDLQKIYENSSYFIYPSFSESFGIAIVEAEASGLYCFVNDFIPSAADAGGMIRLPLHGTPKEWAEAIVKFYNEQKGKKVQFNMERFSRENNKKAYLSLYED